MQKIVQLIYEKTNIKDTYKAIAITDAGYNISPDYFIRKGAEKHFIEKFNRDLHPRCERISEKFFEQSLKQMQ